MRCLTVVTFSVLFSLLVNPAGAAAANGYDIFPAIPEVRAVHGIATLEFYAVLDPRNGEPELEYNGLPGPMPTIRVRPGDTILMTLHNDMPSMPLHRDAVNMHFHGLEVSPNPPADEVIMTLALPGQTLHYRVNIPADHEPGLYWYHPHSHGESYREVTNGMSGAIVIEGMQEHFPALAHMRERIIVLRDVPIGRGPADDDMPMNGMMATPSSTASARRANNQNPCRPELGLQPTLNREPRARIGIAAGERQFFRVVNASAARYYDLSVDGSPLQVVAQDGVPLDAYPGTPPSVVVSHILLPPAGRAEFIVSGTGRPTVLRSGCFNSGKTGDADPAVVLADLVDPNPRPDPSAAPFMPVALTVGKPLPPNWMSRELPAPAVTRTVRFTEDSNGFYINGKAFAMNGPPMFVARSGTVERWTVINDTPEVHDFHIHQVHFIVESIAGHPPALRNWLDTVNVPPHTRVVVTIDFRNPVVRGTFLFHCHILDHEDQGMMAKVQVL
jgi:FtsP/CotA-like multicopper oxidase with cupredoxin domain